MIPVDCIEVYATREEWLAARRELCDCGERGDICVAYRIGASDIGQILGRSPHGGPWDVWLAKREGRSEDDNESMAQGRRWERRVLEDYAEATGAEVSTPDLWAFAQDGVSSHALGAHVLIRHPDLSWATCSPDGFAGTVGTDGPVGGVECKAVMDFGAAAEWADETEVIGPGVFDRATPWPAPLHYVLQVYWSLAVTGLPYWDLAAILMPRRGRLVHHRFMADPAFQAALLAQVQEWRERHLVAGEEPPVDDSAACSRYVSRAPAAGLRKGTEEEIGLVLAMKQHQVLAKLETRAARRLRNELARRLDGATITTPWGRVKPPPAVPEPEPAALEIDDGDPDHLDFSRLHQ